MSEVMKFELASKNGVLLETEGKYCTHNIKVEPVVDDLTITENGTYPVPEGHTGHGDLTVDVKPDLEALTVTENGTYTVPEGTDGYGDVTVDVQPNLAPLDITSNGFYPIPEGYDGYGDLSVQVDDMYPIIKNYTIANYTDSLVLTLQDIGMGVPTCCLAVSSTKALNIKVNGGAFEWRQYVELVGDAQVPFDFPDGYGGADVDSVGEYLGGQITITVANNYFFYADDVCPTMPVYIYDMYGIRACLRITLGESDEE